MPLKPDGTLDALAIMRQPDRAFVISNEVRTPVTFLGGGTFRASRFLNEKHLAFFDFGASELVVSNLNGVPLYRFGIQVVWEANIFPARDGRRFGIFEHGYTFLNTLTHFWDIDRGRPENMARVRVVDLASGKEISRCEWDPGFQVLIPALSPSGCKLARVRDRVLEIVELCH